MNNDFLCIITTQMRITQYQQHMHPLSQQFPQNKEDWNTGTPKTSSIRHFCSSHISRSIYYSKDSRWDLTPTQAQNQQWTIDAHLRTCLLAVSTGPNNPSKYIKMIARIINKTIFRDEAQTPCTYISRTQTLWHIQQAMITEVTDQADTYYVVYHIQHIWRPCIWMPRHSEKWIRISAGRLA